MRVSVMKMKPLRNRSDDGIKKDERWGSKMEKMSSIIKTQA